MNQLQQAEKRYANLKLLWEKERQKNKILLEALEAADDLLDDVWDMVDEDKFDRVWKLISDTIAKAKGET